MMKVYHDPDANLGALAGLCIAVIGYGNQGRAQAQNLRDSGLDVVVGNRPDTYEERSRADGFQTRPIDQAAQAADVVMLLIPDEVAVQVYQEEVASHLVEGNVLVFASGYNVAFGAIQPPPGVDTVLVAPRMVGAGVRDLFVSGQGFPSFIGVAQDASGRAREYALGLAKGIGSTRAGVVEVSFAQEAELDLFTEQCFGPAFGYVLTTAVSLLLEQGYPSEAVLLELYMSGELSYTLGKIAELGMIAQTDLHSRTSQYGSMSRGMRFMLPELRAKMEEGLQEIRGGAFAREWAREQQEGSPTLELLKETARSLPLHRLEQELRQELQFDPSTQASYARAEPARHHDAGGTDLEDATAGDPAIRQPSETGGGSISPDQGGKLAGWAQALRRRSGRGIAGSTAPVSESALDAAQLERVVTKFMTRAGDDPALKAFSQDRRMTMHFVLTEPDVQFFVGLKEGAVVGSFGAPESGAELRLKMAADVFDGMLTGRTNAMLAAMTGKLTFEGDARQAMAMQTIQGDLVRLYRGARDAAGRGDR